MREGERERRSYPSRFLLPLYFSFAVSARNFNKTQARVMLWQPLKVMPGPNCGRFAARSLGESVSNMSSLRILRYKNFSIGFDLHKIASLSSPSRIKSKSFALPMVVIFQIPTNTS
jgi:hypothetical protein